MAFEIFGFRMFMVIATIFYYILRLKMKPYENDQQFKWNSEKLISYSKGSAFSFKSTNYL